MKNCAQSDKAGQCPRDIRSIALEHSRNTAELAKRMADAAIKANSVMALRAAYHLYKCSEPENHWIGYGLRKANGETFDGSGTFLPCRQYFCPSCSVRRATNARKGIREAIANISLDKREKWRLITFTGPRVQGAILETVMDVYLDSFSLLRKRKLWVTNVKGGARSFEFTVNDTEYHGHHHVLVASKWMTRNVLSAIWSECLLSAWAKHGVEVSIDTPQGHADVDISLVSDMYTGPSLQEIPLGNAVQKVANYICKGSEWIKVRSTDLVKIAEIKLPHLFSTLGQARGHHARTYLDTRQLNDGRRNEREFSHGNRPRYNIEVVDSSTFKKQTDLKYMNARPYRKGQLKQCYGSSRLVTLSGIPFHNGSSGPNKTGDELGSALGDLFSGPQMLWK